MFEKIDISMRFKKSLFKNSIFSAVVSFSKLSFVNLQIVIEDIDLITSLSKSFNAFISIK